MRAVDAMDAIAARLGGLAAQEVFRFPTNAVPGHFRRSSVLILFAPHAGRMSVLLTRRAPRLSSHAGDICFPGGKLEPGEDAVAAALREAWEEVGLDPSHVSVRGRLDDAWAFGGYVLEAVVATVESMPTWFRTSSEVDAVLVEPVSSLADPSNRRLERVRYRGVDYLNESIPLSTSDLLYGLSADLFLEVIERLEHGRTERGRARLEELRQSKAAGHWPST